MDAFEYKVSEMGSAFPDDNYSNFIPLLVYAAGGAYLVRRSKSQQKKHEKEVKEAQKRQEEYRIQSEQQFRQAGIVGGESSKEAIGEVVGNKLDIKSLKNLRRLGEQGISRDLAKDLKNVEKAEVPAPSVGVAQPQKGNTKWLVIGGMGLVAVVLLVVFIKRSN